ncbi:MAG: hypothetical protein Q7U48_13930 [Hydrogenophaga sp.]|jgi:hypothetical protein|nr:hypothetical protein [Hydrogenophaga sp.]
MATEILSIGSNNSAEFTVLSGTPVTLILRGAGNAAVKMKGSDDSFITIGQLDASAPVQVLDVPGTFIVSRLNGADVEVDKEG